MAPQKWPNSPGSSLRLSSTSTGTETIRLHRVHSHSKHASRLRASRFRLILITMGQLIQFPRRVLVTKNHVLRRAHEERERALAHAHMMMVGAIVTTGLMMLCLALLSYAG